MLERGKRNGVAEDDLRKERRSSRGIDLGRKEEKGNNLRSAPLHREYTQIGITLHCLFEDIRTML